MNELMIVSNELENSISVLTSKMWIISGVMIVQLVIMSVALRQIVKELERLGKARKI